MPDCSSTARPSGTRKRHSLANACSRGASGREGESSRQANPSRQANSPSSRVIRMAAPLPWLRGAPSATRKRPGVTTRPPDQNRSMRPPPFDSRNAEPPSTRVSFVRISWRSAASRSDRTQTPAAAVSPGMTNVTPSQTMVAEPRMEMSAVRPPPAGRKAERTVRSWSSSVPATTVQKLPSLGTAPDSPQRRIGSMPSAARMVSRLPSTVNGPSSLGSVQAISMMSPSDACRTASPTVPQSSSTAGESTTRQTRRDGSAPAAGSAATGPSVI